MPFMERGDSHPRNAGFRLAISGLFFAAVMLMLAACTDFNARRDAVVITAVPKAVERCTRLGFVAADSPLTDVRDGQRQLQEATYRRGGNTVLVRSPAFSLDGEAYVCNPPLPRDPTDIKLPPP